MADLRDPQKYLPFPESALSAANGLPDNDRQDEESEQPADLKYPEPPTPPFRELLENPLVDQKLPPDFDVATEEGHLKELWEKSQALRNFDFERFVHAGGSGMVFKVSLRNTAQIRALKIARHKLFELSPTTTDLARSLSPVSESELRALETLSHPNLVRLYDVLENDSIVFGIATSYVESPTPLDSFLQKTLSKTPKGPKSQGPYSFSPERLHGACSFLSSRLLETASALKHMHEQSVYHFDIKPANILIAKTGSKPILTDMGACIHSSDFEDGKEIRVHFTWTYGHPVLQSLTSDPEGISGGGLKASARVDPDKGLARFDLFAFGKTILELLGALELEFGERCYSSYGFRYLHLIGSLLLDGRNAPAGDAKGQHLHGRYFVSDLALGYPKPLFSQHRIRTASELVKRLKRFGESASFDLDVPELAQWHDSSINLALGYFAPYTDRVTAIANHPAFQRLKLEPQLGWIREVYPGATHTRWAHSIGVYASLSSYYSSLLSDPEIPTFRILADSSDIEHALIAGLIHDIGQSAFGHDFEAAAPEIFDHKRLVSLILQDTHWGKLTLGEAIRREWPKVDIDRVLRILGAAAQRSTTRELDVESQLPVRPIDGIAVDAIDGPIDADKFDYVHRDSHFCGVSYGRALDRTRFLQSLSVAAVQSGPNAWQFGLAYKAKGRPAIESLLLARYQLYGSVYWHHTFRCIQAMFVHSARLAFNSDERDRVIICDTSVAKSTTFNIFYHRVVCRKPWDSVRNMPGVKDRKLPPTFFDRASSIDAVSFEPAFDFLWRCAPDRGRHLIELLAQRTLYKRVFELRVSALGQRADYGRMCADLDPRHRVQKAEVLQQSLCDAVSNKMRRREPEGSATEVLARSRFESLEELNVPLVVVDFPTRGVPDEPNVPVEIADHERKYFLMSSGESMDQGEFFHGVRGLQARMATVRIYAHPALHELIIRYLSQDEIWSCVEDLVPGMKRRPH